MSTVVFTALGCLYFMDTNSVASSTGLQAVGALLLILNLAYLICMALLIAKTGFPKARRMASRAASMTQAGSSHAKGWVMTSMHKCSSRALGRQLSNRAKPAADATCTQPNVGTEFHRGSSMQISLLELNPGSTSV